MTVAEKIRQLRGDMALRPFAQKLGLSAAAILRMENGTHKPGLRSILSLMKESGKNLDYWSK